MNNKGILITIFFFYLVLSACSKLGQGNDIVSDDLTKPDPIGNVKVKNINGGAIITYTLPKSLNLLYIQADYTINDKTGIKRQSKSSYYSDTTIVDGFSQSQDYMVELRAISRAGVSSAPVQVTVHPDTPAYLLVRKSLELSPDFSGVLASAENPLKKKIGVVMLYDDPDYGNYVIREQKFSEFDKISYSTRGFDTLPKEVAAYVTDEYGNMSDTLYKEILPLYEVALDIKKFFPYTLPTDKPPYTGDYSVERIYNGIGGEDLWHTALLSGEDALYPYYCTFGIGPKAKLSRFTVWERPAAPWASMNAKTFSIWGSDKDLPQDVRLPMDQPEGTVIGDWINLGNFRYPDPPSGNSPGSATSADYDYLVNGVDFLMPNAAPAVKYIRVSVESTWGNTNFAGMSDIKFFGDTRNL